MSHRHSVGIYSGTFDPVHAGHIAFALDAIKQAGLSRVYFLPERMPRGKAGVTHYAHRLTMLEIALRPYSRLRVLDLPDKQFSVQKTLPRLKSIFNDKEISLLVGSDVAQRLTSDDPELTWPGYKKMLSLSSLVVGVRQPERIALLTESLLEISPDAKFITTQSYDYSSSSIRSSIMSGKTDSGLLRSLAEYVRLNWLYTNCSGDVPE